MDEIKDETAFFPAGINSWQFEAAGDSPAISFDIASMEDVPVWRTELPSDLEQAGIQLMQNEVRIENTLSALNTTPDRIDLLVRQAQLSGTGMVWINFPSGLQTRTAWGPAQ